MYGSLPNGKQRKINQREYPKGQIRKRSSGAISRPSSLVYPAHCYYSCGKRLCTHLWRYTCLPAVVDAAESYCRIGITGNLLLLAPPVDAYSGNLSCSTSMASWESYLFSVDGFSFHPIEGLIQAIFLPLILLFPADECMGTGDHAAHHVVQQCHQSFRYRNLSPLVCPCAIASHPHRCHASFTPSQAIPNITTVSTSPGGTNGCIPKARLW